MADIGTGMTGLAGRYASALLDLADDSKQLDQVADDLRNIKAAFQESQDLREMVRSPLYSRDQKAAVVGAIVDKLGATEMTARFIKVVGQNRRLFALVSIIDTYLAELAKRRGEVTAKVKSARSLSEQQQNSLTDALRAAVGSKVQVDVTVDPSLIGGLIVQVGSRMVDSSLRSKLQRLQLAMKGVG